MSLLLSWWSISGPALLHSLECDIILGMDKKTKRDDKLLGLMLSGTSMLHECYRKSCAKVEPTLYQVKVSNSIQTRIWKKTIHESWANLSFKRKLYTFYHVILLKIINMQPYKDDAMHTKLLYHGKWRIGQMLLKWTKNKYDTIHLEHSVKRFSVTFWLLRVVT